MSINDCIGSDWMLVDGTFLVKEATGELIEKLDVRMVVTFISVMLVGVYGVVIGAVLLL